MICLFLLVCFNKTSILSSKYTHDDIERHRFSRGFFLMYPLIFPAFSLSFFSFLHRSVTLVTAKKQHCGWNARTYVHLRVHARNAPRKFSLHFFPHFLFFLLLFSFLFPHSPSLPPSSGASNTCKFLFCYMRITDLNMSKEKSAHFLDFFTLWGNIDPYTNRGMHCNPPSVQKLMTCIEY